MFKRLLIFLLIASFLVGGLLFYGWWKDRENPTKDWPWYRNPEFKYRLRYPPHWIIETVWMVEGRQIYIVSPEEKQSEEENLAICEGKKEGICEPERPQGGIFVEVIDKSKNQNLKDWFEEEHKDSEIYNKEGFEVRIINGIKVETNGLYSVYNIFLAQPSYILKLSQYAEETPELSLVAKSVQLPEEGEMSGIGFYIPWLFSFFIIFYCLPRWVIPWIMAGRKKS